MQIDAHKRSVEEILQIGQHVIPRYQRRFAWDEQNIHDFWTDLDSSSGPHFLGSMVVSGATSQPREVIDGQQRLTTILIALAALRDLYTELGEDQLVTGIMPFIEYADRSGSPQYRLINRDPNAQNRLRNSALTAPALRIPEGSADPKSREYQAHEQFTSLLRERMREMGSGVAVLDQFRDKILETEIVYINVEDRKNAFTIFETLNDRGKSLTTMDLTKNLLFSQIASDPGETIERSWSEIIEAIDESDLEGLTSDLFLYYFWNSLAPESGATGETVEQTRIRRAISDTIDAAGDPEGRARSVLADMHETSRILRCLSEVLTSGGSPDPWKTLDGGWRRDKYESISASVYGILVTGSNQPFPLLISLVRAYVKRECKFKHGDMLEFLIAIENFQFRWSISKKPSTSSIRRLYRHSATLVDVAVSARDFKGCLDGFKASSAPLIASDKQFKEGLSQLAYSNGQKKDVFKVRYVLNRLELEGGDSRLPLNRQMSIEHIQGQAGRSEDTRRNFWIFKLGNLTLLPPEVNAGLPEKFTDKAAILDGWVRPSDRVLKDAIHSSGWDNAKYNERHDALLAEAVAIWPGNDVREGE